MEILRIVFLVYICIMMTIAASFVVLNLLMTEEQKRHNPVVTFKWLGSVMSFRLVVTCFFIDLGVIAFVSANAPVLTWTLLTAWAAFYLPIMYHAANNRGDKEENHDISY